MCNVTLRFLQIMGLLCISLVLWPDEVHGIYWDKKYKEWVMPNEEYLLVLEHSCIKHMQKGEFRRAREVWQFRSWQAANRKAISGDEGILRAQPALDAARAAKAQMGEQWHCDPPPARLELALLTIGRDPQTASPITKSFVSTSVDSVEINATATLLSECESPALKWHVAIPKYDLSKSYTNEYAISPAMNIPQFPGGNRGAECKVKVNAQLFCKGTFADDFAYNIGQSDQDQLRQEYIDMKKTAVPQREDLVADVHTKHFDLNQFNTSQKAGGGRYDSILCRILPQLEAVRHAAGDVSMHINSGYRNPFKNGNTDGSGRESPHIYGRAADIAMADFNADGKTNKDDRVLMEEAARNAGACIEPWRRTSSWIHMDWRGACPPGW